MENNIFDTLRAIPLSLGADRSQIISTDEIVLDRSFRDVCASNACGMYGRCYTCPPDVGDIDKLMAEVSQYDHALVYQTVSALEDSFDYEGMVEARELTDRIAKGIRSSLTSHILKRVLHLGPGGCSICKVCGKLTGEPCRFPSLAMPSLESYGINVSCLAEAADMKYINGQSTVTYFGAVLFTLGGEYDE